MSEHGQKLPATPVSQVVIAILGALIAPTLILVLIAKLLMGIDASHIDDPDPALATAQIEDRIKPIGAVEVAAVESGPRIDKTGEQVVTAVCSACHTSGALGSPKIGDKSAWGPRIAQGYDTLIKHAIAGIRSMPARGGNPDLTDGEIANAVAYMANQSGANFTAPAPASAGAEAAPSSPAPASTAAAPATPAKVTDAAGRASTPAAKEGAEAKPAETKLAESKPAEVKPVVVAEAEKPAAASGKSGEEVVKGVCAMCHAAGLMGAPKIGDAASWEPRIAQGYDTLVQHANKGIRMMPAKGGNPGLSDQEVARAVAYMANQSGAKFTEAK